MGGGLVGIVLIYDSQLSPTVIRDASISGDFSVFKDTLPGKEFFVPEQVFQPFTVPERRSEQGQ